MKAIRCAGLAAALAISSLGAQAALLSRGGGTMYYDDVLNITWLADWNYAATSGYDLDGFMTWGAAGDAAGAGTANGWISSLNAGGGLYGGTGWRLPTMSGIQGCASISYDGSTDCGYNVPTATSEMAHLFYATLGNLGDFDSLGNYIGPNVLNSGPFTNLQAEFYWSGTEFSAAEAWMFSTFDGFQVGVDKSFEMFAVAVRDGDVPEPQSLALVLLALGAGVVATRRRPG